MATNDFLPFAGGAGANVLTQAAYLAQAALRSNGFSAGTAQSAQLNKVWRQSSIMAAALAQMISDNTGADVLDDGTTATILANLKTAVKGRLLNIQVFTSNGTYVPTPGTKSVLVEVVGGGGGGGGAIATSGTTYSNGTGGGAGGYARSYLTSGFSGVAVTVGVGGTGVTGAAGNNGGTTSFGSLLSATGGAGGNAGAASTGTAFTAGALGGIGSGGNEVNAQGTDGDHAQGQSTGNFIAGAGGASYFGAGGSRLVPTTSAGRDASSPGSAGSGAASVSSGAAQRGGNGASGIALIFEYA